MDAVVGCVTSDPDDDVTWYRDGQPIASSDRHVIERHHDNSTLQFIYAGRDELGAYVCKVDEENQVVVTLRSAPYVYYKKSVNLNAGATLELECRGFGLPEPSVTWFRAELPLVEDGKRIKFVNTTAMINGLLIIENLELDDYNNYMCTATNEFGSYNSTTLVRVKSKFRGLWPIMFIGIQLAALGLIIIIFERRKKKSE